MENNPPIARTDLSKNVRSAAVTDLHHVFIDLASKAYANEKAIARAMPALKGYTESEALKAFVAQREISAAEDLVHLGYVFYMMGEEPKASGSSEIDFMLVEAKRSYRQFGNLAIADVAMASRLLLHAYFDRALYLTLRSLAQTLGKNDVFTRLHGICQAKTVVCESLTAIIQASELEILEPYSE